MIVLRAHYSDTGEFEGPEMVDRPDVTEEFSIELLKGMEETGDYRNGVITLECLNGTWKYRITDWDLGRGTASGELITE